jgi:mRNA interferase MazF
MTRGDIWWADFGVPFGSEPGFRRPIVIIQDDAFNRSRINTVIIIPLTTNLALAEAPGNVLVEKEESGLTKDSVLVVSQLSAIDRRRLVEQSGKLDKQIQKEAEEGIKLVLGMK